MTVAEETSVRPVRGPDRSSAGPIAVAAVVAGATLTLALRSPHVTGSYGACPSVALFGVWCPACGGLRAVHDLAHADLVGAWAHNQLLVVAVPLMVAAWVRWLGVTRGWWRPGPLPTWIPWVALAALVVFGILRNVSALADLAPPQ